MQQLLLFRATFPLQRLQKSNHRSVHLTRALLLGPMTATRQHDLLSKLRDGLREVRQRLFSAGKLHYQVAIASDVEGWHRYFRA